ncbi:hypothetical protein EDD16DRAFT_1703578 [Pisolithus croceorrhizus]|nr:hypothetical protein EDD16DRAFT_1703578 [Pisolithus croceorrhizus]
MEHGTVSKSTISHRWSKHPEFYTHTVTFLVEDQLFRVPWDQLAAESTVFTDMFLLPKGDSEMPGGQSDSETVEGESDECPVTLEGVSKKEFESFLRALMSRSVQHSKNKGSSLSQTQWISVLRLSTMWEFKDLREVAIQHLDLPSRPLAPVEKFVLASKYGIKRWLLPALTQLAERPWPISVEEGRRIGLENALKLAAVRERLKVANTVAVDWIEQNFILKRRDEASKKHSDERSKPLKSKDCGQKSTQIFKDKEEGNGLCVSLLTKAFDL